MVQGALRPYRSEHEFQTQGEYWDYVRTHEIRSLQGDQVKSYEECEIANFLYLNGVPYAYEADYEHETATPEKRQYQPDFHLTEAGIYIEHLALTKSGETPPFIDRDEYLRSLDWKRRLHAEHGTVLIETYSHEKAAGTLIRNLEAKLAAHEVALRPIPADEIFTVLERQGRIDPFTRLVATFLHHYKGAQLTADEVTRRAARVSPPPAGARVRQRVPTDLRALSGVAEPAGADRLPRHDREGNDSTWRVDATVRRSATSSSTSSRTSRPGGHGC